MMISIQNKPDGIVFKVFIQPRSSKNQVAGCYGDALKIKLTAPPVDGEANMMCVKYIAKLLSVPKSAIEIISGQTSRTKHIRIQLRKPEAVDTEAARVIKVLESLAV